MAESESVHLRTLMTKIHERKAVVGIMGLGYVGLPLAATFHTAGFRTMGFDTDLDKVTACQTGSSYLEHIPDAEGVFKRLAESPTFMATSDMALLAEADAVLICVPTPLGGNFEPDLQYVEACARRVAETLRSGQLVVLESTTYPGTTRERLQPLMDERGLRLGDEYFLAFSPEREDPGNKNHAMCSIPKVVGGVDVSSGTVATALYEAAFSSVHKVSRAEVAEAAKLLENIYRAVNIALVNELKMVLTKMDIDIWEVLDAAETKPFGFHRFNPGPGWGGHCIPVDPFYLTWKARAVGMHSHFIELAGEINRQMPVHVVQKVQEALNEDCKPLKGSRVLLLGVAYKADICDTRETPAFVIWKELERHKAVVCYHDPLVPRIGGHLGADYAFLAGRESVDEGQLQALLREGLDAVVVVTAHTDFKRTTLPLLPACNAAVIDSRRLVPDGGALKLFRA